MGTSAFKGASSAQGPSEKGQNLGEGKSLVKVTGIKMPANLQNGDAYIVEYEVVKSDTGNDPVTGRPLDPPGAKRRWYQSMVKKSVAFPNLHGFIYAACGYDRRNREDAAGIETNIKPEIESILDASVDESDPLKFVGRLIEVTTKKTKTKPKPDGAVYEYMVHDFAPGQSDKLL